MYEVEKHVSCSALSTVLAGRCQQHREYTELLLRRLLKLPSLKCPSSKVLVFAYIFTATEYSQVSIYQSQKTGQV